MAAFFDDVGWSAAAVIGLTLLSQTFAGLNIALMSLDTAQLQMLIDGPKNDPQAIRAARCAKMILPLRQKGNRMLCTILIGNVAANFLMAMVWYNLVGALYGWAITTAIIVFFCEVLPQSLCTRKGLFLGAAGVPLLQVFVILLYPVTLPYTIVLDWVFPQRENLLNREQLRSLVEFQKAAMPGTLESGQAQMLIGALGYAQRRVHEVMIPMDKAFTLSFNTPLDYDALATVVRRGFTRVPILHPKNKQVEGILHCKELLRQRFAPKPGSGDDAIAERRQTAGELLMSLRAAREEPRVYVCSKNTRLATVLAEFKTSSHIAVVADNEEPGEAVLDRRTGLPVRHIGILTMNNITEVILQGDAASEPIEETRESPRLRHPETPACAAMELLDRTSLRAMASAGAPIGEPESEALLSFLVASDAVFENIGEERLLAMLRHQRFERFDKGTELYKRGQASNLATLVLSGHVQVESGEDEFQSIAGPWSFLGLFALELADVRAGVEFIPDFSATVLSAECLVMRIDRNGLVDSARQPHTPSRVAAGS